MDFNINCPKCGTKIDLSKRIAEFVQAQVKKESEGKIREETKKIRDEEREKSKSQIEQLKRENENRIEKEAHKRASKLAAEEISKKDSYYKEQRNRDELTIAEQKGKLEDAYKTIQKLHEEGSPQVKGIISENDLYQYLKTNLPVELCEVKKIGQGKKGTDIIINVRKAEKQIGSIIVDNKWADKWGTSWPEKVWNDMREHNANFAYIACKPSAMPEELKEGRFGIAPCKRTGIRVWVLDRNNLSLVLGILSDSIDKIVKMAEIKSMYGAGSKPVEKFREYLTTRYENDLREKAKQMSTAVKSLNDMYKKVETEYRRTMEALRNYWMTESKVHQNIAIGIESDIKKSIPQIKGFLE